MNTTIVTLEMNVKDMPVIAELVEERWGIQAVEITRPKSTCGWIELYFDDEIQAELVREAMATLPEVIAVVIRGYSDRDWESYLKQSFKAIEVGESLLVAPEWDDAYQKRYVGTRRIIRMNPGLSFGTGQHFTTRFCLETLEGLFLKESITTMFDAGCGSGILAITAAVLGCKKVLAVDNDPQAVEQAQQNMACNDVLDCITAECMDLSVQWPQTVFDLVCANIYTKMLLEQAPALARVAKKRLVLTGIRENEVDRVADTFLGLGMRELIRDGDGEWAGLMFGVG